MYGDQESSNREGRKERERKKKWDEGRVKEGGPDAGPCCRVTVFIMILKARIESDTGFEMIILSTVWRKE